MQFDFSLITQIIPYLFGAGGLGMAIVERRKHTAITKGVEADAETKEINNSGKVVDLYKQALDDLAVRYEKKFEEISGLYERKIKVLEDEIKLHKRMVLSLKKENASLRRQLKEATSDGNSN